MARKWFGLIKLQEEMNELGVELMKLSAFPDGKHPGRKRSIILSMEDEIADVLAATNYMMDRNDLDRTRIEKRAKTKYKKFTKWWGVPESVAKIASKVKTRVKTNAKRRP